MDEWGLNEYLEWLDDMAEQIAENFESLYGVQRDSGKVFLYRPFASLGYLMNSFETCALEPDFDVNLDFKAGENDIVENHIADLKAELKSRYDDVKNQREEFYKRYKAREDYEE